MKDEVVELFLNAEEELRNGNDNKCLDLKEQFSDEYEKLSNEDKQYVKDYLESVGA